MADEMHVCACQKLVPAALDAVCSRVISARRVSKSEKLPSSKTFFRFHTISFNT